MSEIFLVHTARTELDAALATDPDAILLTSRHGAFALAALTALRDLPLLCVGETTAHAARAVGFSRVFTAGGTIDKLIDMVAGAYDEDARLLYVSGQHVSADLPGTLAGLGMETRRVVTYEAQAAEKFSDTLAEQLKRGQIDAVTFLSPRAGRIFAALLRREQLDPRSLRACALSESVASSVGEEGWKGLHVAREATLASLVECVDNALHDRG